MWFKAYVQQEHCCGSSTWWPTWKTGLIWKSFSGTESVSVLVLVDSPSLQCPKNVAQQTQNLLQMFVWEMLDHHHTFWIWHQQFLSISHTEGALVMTLFHLLWRCQTCYSHVADTAGAYVLCIWDGQTCLNCPVKGAVLKNNLLLAPGKIFPLICGYCKCSFWSIFLHGSFQVASQLWLLKLVPLASPGILLDCVLIDLSCKHNKIPKSTQWPWFMYFITVLKPCIVSIEHFPWGFWTNIFFNSKYSHAQCMSCPSHYLAVSIGHSSSDHRPKYKMYYHYID